MTPQRIAETLTEAQKFALTGVVHHTHGQSLIRQGATKTLEALERKGLTYCLSSLTNLGLTVRAILLKEQNYG